MLNRIYRNPNTFLFNPNNQAVVEAKYAALIASMNLRNTIVLYIIGIAMLLLGAVALKSYLLILNMAPSAQVDAQSFHLLTDSKGNTVLDYTYRVNVNGKPSYLDGNYVITPTLAAKIAAVKTLPIKYIPNDPTVSRTALEDISMIDYRQPLVLLAVVIGCFAWATLRLIGFLRVTSIARQYKGKLVQGKLTDVDVDSGGQATVHYQFSLPFGKKQEGQLMLPGQQKTLFPASGTPIWVLYQSNQQHQVL